MKQLSAFGLVLVILAPSLLAAVAPAPPSTSANPAETQVVGRLVQSLARSTGVGVRPVPSVPGVSVDDPRAAELARRLATVRGLQAAAAAGVNAGPAPAAGGRRSSRLAAFRKLFGPAPGVQLHLRPANDTVVQLRGPLLAAPNRQLAAGNALQRDTGTARSLLRAAGELLGTMDPDAEWRLDRVEPDDLGGHRVRFLQQWRGLPVWPCSLAVHLDAQGQAVLLEGAYVPSPVDTPTEPRVAAEEALLRGRASIPGGMRAEAGAPVLIIHAPLEGEPRLAWRFPLNLGLAQAWELVVDALDGRVLRRANRVLDANVTGSGRDLRGTTLPLQVWKGGATHYLIDTSKPMFKAGSDPVANPQGAISIGDAGLKKINDLKTSDIAQITSADPNNWSVPDGVSAAYNFSKTYDYFLETHARNSLDGNGGNITAVVRIADYDNASWNGNVKLMLFGNVQPYADAMDVVGHELTHGLTENSAGLVYENQSGAMNESFSDIFGEMVEAYATGTLDWKMGTRLAEVFRDFRQPGSLTIGGLNRPYPSRMSEFVQLPNTDDSDHGGVHINSSILNHCFWQLAEGLPAAIGRLDASRIFFRTLTRHLQPQSQFIDARLGAITSAEALFGAGSTQATATAAAFDAVEILSAPETPPPPSVPVVQAPDSTLFLATDPFFGAPALYRSEAALGDGPLGELFAFDTLVSRPAVTGDGSEALYISSDHDLCYTETGNPNAGDCLGFTGEVQSVAISPDGRYGAFVFRDPRTGDPDNRITILDLGANTNATFELLAPSIDGVPVDGILFADAMTFSTDSSVLFYDAVSQLRFGNGPAVLKSSIYGLHLATGKISIVVPPIEGVDTGNPHMGRTGNRHLVFDALVEGSGNSVLLTLDLFTGDAGQIATVDGGLGFPCFSGDEAAVVYAQRDTRAGTTGYSLVRQALSPDRLAPQGDPTLWAFDARLGVLYRRGTFTGNNEPPSSSITAPAAGATLAPGVATVIQAAATDPDGTVVRVEFFDGDIRLGEDTSAPFSLTWTPGTTGSHRLIARATDNLGGVRDSGAIVVQVGSEPPPAPARLSAELLPDRRLRITVRGAAGAYTLSRSADLKTWTDLRTVTVGGGGEVQTDETPTAAPDAAFYRVRRP